MLRIGLTGGIGSGKSTIRSIFSVMGMPVFDADSRAKMLMSNDEDLKAGIQSVFGMEAYTDEGQLNRKYLSERIFKNASMLESLNNIVHPAVRQHFLEWEKGLGGIYVYVIYEAALIFEGGTEDHFDAIVYVFCPEELRIGRVMERDNVNRQDVIDRINNQLPEKDKFTHSDFIIINDGEHKLIPQVMEIDMQLKARQRRSN